MVFVFYDQPFVLMMHGILMIGKHMDEVHWRIANEQQYGKPYRKYVFCNFNLQLFYGQ
jgi:hypothetical protein